MKKILVVLCVYFLSVSVSYASSTIHLKDGDTVTGDIIEQTNEYVRVKFEGIELTYWNDQIEKIELDIAKDVPSAVGKDVKVLDTSQPSNAVVQPAAMVQTEGGGESIGSGVQAGVDSSVQKAGIVVDGSDKDWEGALFVFEEVGEIMPDSFERFDIKKIYMGADQDNLYFLITLNRRIADYFATHQDLCQIADIYLDVDNREDTGCAGMKIFRHGTISGYDYEISLSLGTQASSEGNKPFVSYSLLSSTDTRDRFSIGTTGYKATSLDTDAKVRFADEKIEFMVPLRALNIRRGVNIRGIFVEYANMAINRFVFMVKEGDVSGSEAVKVLETEKVQKQEITDLQPIDNAAAISSAASSRSVSMEAVADLDREDIKKHTMTPAEIRRTLMTLLSYYVFFCFCLQLIAVKTKTSSSWLAWIPIAGLVLMCRIACKPLWWVLLCFVPLVNIVIMVLLWMGIAEARNKPSWLGLGMFLPGVNLIIPAYLAFSK